MNFKLFARSASLMITLVGTAAFAQTGAAPAATASPTPDPYPYQTQMMLRQSDGLIQTIPAFTTNYSLKIPGQLEPRMMKDSAMLYDITNPYTGVSAMGVNWGFFQADEGDTLVTITAGGRLWVKGVKSYRPAVKGGVYFLKAGNMELVTVNSISNTFETNSFFGMPRFVGGNFFIDEDNNLVTIKSTGLFTVWTGVQEYVSQAKKVGGNYFVKNDEVIEGVSSIDGMLKAYVPDAPAKWLGGNYFIGTDNILYTVSNLGVLEKRPEYKFTARPSVMGYSFIKNADGSFVYIDGAGLPHNTMIRVWPAAAKSIPMLQMNAVLDLNAVFMPGFNR